MTENYEKSLEYRENHKNGDTGFDNITKLEKIKGIWENVIIHRKMKISAGKIEVSDISSTDDGDYYNGSEMSDGERAIFYFIAEALSVPEGSLIIIDEPENHLHKSILVRLWNAVEDQRRDCVFLYVTHSLEFTRSRINTEIIWVQKNISNSEWQYEEIPEINTSDELILEIMGNRQKVLLVEGTPDKSIDGKLYAKLFSDYNVIPLADCSSVIHYTKAYRHLKGLHDNEVKGIIDRDRKSDEAICKYAEFNIFAPDVAEIENLFLLPEIIKIVCKKQNKTDEEFEAMFQSVQDKTFEFLEREMKHQALLFTQQICQNSIMERMNEKVNSFEEYKKQITTLIDIDRVDELFSEHMQKVQKVVKEKDFLEALKIINNKGLLPHTRLSNFFGWKKSYYIDYILSLLNIKDEVSEQLRLAFKAYVSIDTQTQQ